VRQNISNEGKGREGKRGKRGKRGREGEREEREGGRVREKRREEKVD
jgi:hypothetical protein